jgi:hypothetical protein
MIFRFILNLTFHGNHVWFCRKHDSLITNSHIIVWLGTEVLDPDQETLGIRSGFLELGAYFSNGWMKLYPLSENSGFCGTG